MYSIVSFVLAEVLLTLKFAAIFYCSGFDSIKLGSMVKIMCVRFCHLFLLRILTACE